MPWSRASDQDKMNLEGYHYYETADFIDHLAGLGKAYLDTPGITEVSLGVTEKRYLTSLVSNLAKHNELFFPDPAPPTFHIIKMPAPFCFSLPGGQFFFSLGILQKYVRTEGILESIIAFEMIRSYRNIYRRTVTVPLGEIPTEKLISLTRLPLSERMQIHKWANSLMRRSGDDSSAYLDWIQIQNRNNLDFILHIGEAKMISQEEFLFKKYVIDNRLNESDNKRVVNPSRGFYEFINFVKRVAP
jgi:hypothetical protein